MVVKDTNRIENVSHGFVCIFLSSWATVNFSRRSLLRGANSSWLTDASAACHVVSIYSMWHRATPSWLFFKAGSLTWYQLITIQFLFISIPSCKCRLFRLRYYIVVNIMQVPIETNTIDKNKSTVCPFNTNCVSSVPWYWKVHLIVAWIFLQFFCH